MTSTSASCARNRRKWESGKRPKRRVLLAKLQVPAPGRRKRARPLGTGQKDPEFEKFRGASARLVQVRSSEHVRKDKIQRPQDDADRRMLGYPFDWGACSQSRYCEIPQMLNPRRTGFERLPLFMWPRIWASRCCMHERSQLRSDRLGWHPGRVSKKAVATRHHLDCARRRHRRSSNRMDLSGPLSTLKDLVSANGSVGALSGYTMLSRFGHFSTASLNRPTSARHGRPVSVRQGV